VLLTPIVVDRNYIGLCLIGRENAMPFSEQEQLWIEAVVSHFSTAFERSGRKS
jgi:hypothetical protein